MSNRAVVAAPDSDIDTTLIAARLAAVRVEMRTQGIDALVVPRADEYLGEYIPQHNERLRWLSGFTGSAGAVIVMENRAAIFVDGRYTVQVRQQVPQGLFEYHHLIDQPQELWLADQLSGGQRVGYDPRLHTLAWVERLERVLDSTDITSTALETNPVDACWADRPAQQIEPALLLSEVYTGESSHHKRCRIGAAIAGAGADAALIFAPDSVSWLLNIRGTDIPMLPVVQSFALLRQDGSCQLFIHPGRVPEGLETHVGEGVEILSEAAAVNAFKALAGGTVMADPNTANAWTQRLLASSGATLLAADDPVLLPKACKNAVEVEGARQAHLRDAVAEIGFLHWLDREVAAGRLHDEATLADTLAAHRAQQQYYQGGSFDTISAAAVNAAMCHYNHRNGVPARLTMDSSYLVDSGGQYLDGTTDITRTVAVGDPGPETRRMFTLVLKGHIALDSARFPTDTSGAALDVLARQYLWQQGFDYDHGTGHGVGAFLSVHEGPQRIARRGAEVGLRPGMIISNEPGYYRDGQYGIRCENLVVVRPCGSAEGDIPVLEFHALTLVPFDQRMLDIDLLTDDEIDWLNTYHQRVWNEVGPQCAETDLDWLRQAVLPVVR